MNCKSSFSLLKPSLIAASFFLLLAAICPYVSAESKVGSDTKDFMETNFKKLRDPFWPIGWEPEPEIPVEKKTKTKKTEIEWPALKLKATGEKYAIIENFGVIEEGSIFSTVRKGVKYSWIMDKVEREGIKVRQLKAVPVK